jgi:NitT/TauT family transport system ATP-binding protein
MSDGIGDSGSQSIHVEGVAKSYSSRTDELAVFDGISFGVAESEFVAIVGPSGCGKTSLLKCIAGIEGYDAGEIYAGGQRVTGPSSDIAMVFQDFVLLPWKTVLENVAVGHRIQTGTGQSEAVAREWVETVGLSGYEDSYPAELSGGMKQRVGLARALAVDPEVLLLDEPFGSLDAQTKDRLQTELLQLWHDEQKTVLFVTHDINEAIYLADRVLVMSEKPSSISREFRVDIDRPRWENRVEIEGSERFKRLRSKLRAELGLASP